MTVSLLAAAALLAEPSPPASAVPWERDHGAAYTRAEETRAPILVQFRADDCERSTAGGNSVPGTQVRSGEQTGLGPRSSSLPGQSTRDVMNDCDLMEDTVWSRPEVVSAAARYVPVLTGDTSDRTLTRRYEAATMPTTLVADPWGNEIVRLVHYVDSARLLRVLDAMPRDFSALEPAGRALRDSPRDPELLLRAAAFYEGARLGEIAEKYYERASLTDGAKKDAAVRRRIAVARGTNLLRGGKPADAARVLQASFEDARDGEQGDVVLFGWMMAELQQGRVKEADRPFRELEKRYPTSRYTARAKENMAAAAATKKG
jgi:hypothetical protein